MSEIAELVLSVRRAAVLGIKPESRSNAPAHFVPAYLVGEGVEVVPVPTYYPEVTEILGQPVYRKVDQVPGELDAVIVFRRPSDLMPHLEELLAARPRIVWLQRGIRNEEFAEAVRKEGIEVVQDRCFMVEHRVAKALVEGVEPPEAHH